MTDKEQTFLVRGLDKATTPDEADTCAKNFFKELRERGIDGYQFIDQMDYAEYEREIDEESVKSNRARDEYHRAQASKEQPGWGKGRGRWTKWPDGSPCWEDEFGREFKLSQSGSRQRSTKTAEPNWGLFYYCAFPGFLLVRVAASSKSCSRCICPRCSPRFNLHRDVGNKANGDRVGVSICACLLAMSLKAVFALAFFSYSNELS